MLGDEREANTVNQGDTADLYAYVYDDNNEVIMPAGLTSVIFEIQGPDEARTRVAGTIQADGAGYLRYTNTSAVGEYLVLARFTTTEGSIRSTRIDFSVVDPFDAAVPTASDLVADKVWFMLEDCFDSEDGGPWLRDQTLSYFNRPKIASFIPFGLLEINTIQPDTHLTLADFTTEINHEENPNISILAYATLLQVIRHLMRSYVEQPTPQGVQVGYEDRRDYLQRWQIIYQQEEPEFRRLATLWKRQFLKLGKSKLLIHSKAGRLYNGPSYRLRNVGRGYF